MRTFMDKTSRPSEFMREIHACHALMRTCVAKDSDHLTHPEGVDTLRLVRNGDVCVHIIVGDPANVTHDFPRPEPRGNDVKRGAERRVAGDREDAGGRGGDQESAGSSPG